MATQTAAPETSAAPPSTSIPDGAQGGAEVSFDQFASDTLGLNDAPDTTEAVAVQDAPPATTDTKPAEGDPQAAAPPKEAATVDEWEIDQATLKLAMKDPNFGKFVQSLHDKYKAALGYREYIPSITEAKEIKALVPGGLAELKELAESARSAQEENSQFMSGDPAKQAVVLSSIAADNPQAFASAAPEYLKLLAQHAPEAYQSTAKEFALTALTADGVPQIVSQMFAAADAQDEKAFSEAFGKFHEWASKTGMAGAPAAKTAQPKTVDPETKALQERLSKYEEKEKHERVENFKSFGTAVNTKVEESAKTEITTRIESVLPKNLPTNVREGLIEDLTDKIWNETLSRLNTDHSHGQKIVEVLGKDRWLTDRDKSIEQVVNLSIGRAKQLIPVIAAEKLSRYTAATVAANNEKQSKEIAAASRKEVAPGGPDTSQRRKPLTKKDVAGMSDEDILNID